MSVLLRFTLNRFASALVLTLIACGAKTGLYVDDAGVDTTTMDVPPDTMEPMLPCVEPPVNGTVVTLNLDVEAEIGRADVSFLIDHTASMGEEIAAIQRGLRDRIAPAIQEVIPDSQIAVATFADFPVAPYGGRNDLPFSMRIPMTRDLAQVQTVLDSVSLADGGDLPESYTEALYQLITGAGVLPFVSPNIGCPSGGIGFACARRDSLHVVLLFTDAETHEGPRNTNPYSGRELSTAHNYNDMVTVARAAGVVILGFDSGDAGSNLRRIIDDISPEGGVRSIGSNGRGLNDTVVGSIQTLAGTIEQDFGAEAYDPDATDGVDITQLITAIRPISASPASAVRQITDSSFLGVSSGALLTWGVDVRNDLVPQRQEPQVFRAGVRFIADGTRLISRQEFLIVIPGLNGSGCDDI